MLMCMRKSSVIFSFHQEKIGLVMVFQDNNASLHRAKGIKAFFSRKANKIHEIARKQSAFIFKRKFTMENILKIVYEKPLSTKEDLLTTILESWNHFDKRHCFELVKSKSERIKNAIKARGGAIKVFFSVSQVHFFLCMAWKMILSSLFKMCFMKPECSGIK